MEYLKWNSPKNSFIGQIKLFINMMRFVEWQQIFNVRRRWQLPWQHRCCYVLVGFLPSEIILTIFEISVTSLPRGFVCLHSGGFWFPPSISRYSLSFACILFTTTSSKFFFYGLQTSLKSLGFLLCPSPLTFKIRFKCQKLNCMPWNFPKKNGSPVDPNLRWRELLISSSLPGQQSSNVGT